MTHKFNPGFDDHAFYSHDDDGPCPSPTRICGWPEPEYRDPMQEMADRVAELPLAMHQSLDGEGYGDVRTVYERRFLKGAREARLREAVRSALLADLPVMGGERFEALVDRVVAAVEALEEK